MTIDTTNTTETERSPVQETAQVPAEGRAPVKQLHILIFYEDNSGKITLPLDRHLQLMYRRLGSQVRRHYFRYETIKEPKAYTGEKPFLKEQYEKEKAEYEQQLKDYKSARANMIRFLQQDQLLLILFVSNFMMECLWQDMDQDPELCSLLTNPNHRIAPILITPTAGFASNCEPLSAYEGVAHDVACQHIAETLEAIARDYFGEALERETVTPFTLLNSPAAIHVSLPSKTEQTTQILAGLLGPIQTMFEQTQTRIVEQGQQVLALQSGQASEQELRHQMDQMQQKIRTLEAKQNAGWRAKLSRFIGNASSN